VIEKLLGFPLREDLEKRCVAFAPAEQGVETCQEIEIKGIVEARGDAELARAREPGEEGRGLEHLG
jgi:hypothetical protein